MSSHMFQNLIFLVIMKFKPVCSPAFEISLKVTLNALKVYLYRSIKVIVTTRYHSVNHAHEANPKRHKLERFFFAFALR